MHRERLQKIIHQCRAFQIADAFKTAACLQSDQPIVYVNAGYAVVPWDLADDPEVHFEIDGQIYRPSFCYIKKLRDRVLDEMRLRILKIVVEDSSVTSASHVQKETWLTQALFLRIGLLLAVLEQSREHLSNRTSGGMRTIQHELVKATFARAVADVEMVYSHFFHSDEASDSFDLSALGFLHGVISEAMQEPLKLMGGHGYLLSGTCKFGYLSQLLANLLDINAAEKERVAKCRAF